MLIDASQSCHLYCVSSTNSQGTGAGTDMHYLSSAAHLVRVRCVQVSLLFFWTAKGYMTVRRVFATAGRIDRGIVDTSKACLSC